MKCHLNYSKQLMIKKNELNDNNEDDDKDEEPLTLKIDNKDTTIQK